MLTKPHDLTYIVLFVTIASALLADAASLQSESALTDTGQQLSVTMATVGDQGTVIKNYDTCDGEPSRDGEADSGNNIHPFGEEGAGEEDPATVIENCGAHDSVNGDRDGHPVDRDSVLDSEGREEEATVTVIVNDGASEKESDDTNGGDRGGGGGAVAVTEVSSMDNSEGCRAPKDVLFFMRDQQSHTQLKQVCTT